MNIINIIKFVAIIFLSRLIFIVYTMLKELFIKIVNFLSISKWINPIIIWVVEYHHVWWGTTGTQQQMFALRQHRR